ncbi:hypothetical protein F4810DRAFT_656831 [Camillea tinctor]|nr:hypothetical protein F4810DRAFT_656831 [Camillea tinctor]
MENNRPIAKLSQTKTGFASDAGKYFDSPIARINVDTGVAIVAGENIPSSQQGHDRFEGGIESQEPILSPSGTGRDDPSPSSIITTDSSSSSSFPPFSTTGTFISITITTATVSPTAANTAPNTVPVPAQPTHPREWGRRLEGREPPPPPPAATPGVEGGDEEKDAQESQETHAIAASLAMIKEQGRPYKCVAALLLVVLYVGAFL